MFRAFEILPAFEGFGTPGTMMASPPRRVVVILALAATCCSGGPRTRVARERGPDAAALHEAAAAHDLRRVEHLIEGSGVSPDARNRDGLTPLRSAILALDAVYWHPPSRQTADVVAYLLTRGADPNVPFRYGDVEGYTLLHFAAFDGNMVLTPILVSAGANVNARDSRGWTPLHSAATCDFRLSCDDCSNAPGGDLEKRWHQGAKPVIRYLLDNGADLSARTHDGTSVLATFRTPCTGRVEPCDPSTRPAATPGQTDDQAWAPGACREAYLFVRRELARRGLSPRD